MTTSIAWGDWDGDGNLDLAVGNYGQPDYVYVNQGETLSLTLTGELGWVSQNISNTRSLAWGDWDRDGDLDLAAGHCGIDEAESREEAAVIYENDSGTLQFNPDLDVGWQSPQAFCTRSVGWGDWDNDGDLDLYCANYGVGAKNVLFANNGDGTWTLADNTIAPVFNRSSSTGRMRIVIHNTGRVWRPGMFIRASLNITGKDSVLTINSDAVQIVDDEDVVFVPGPSNSFFTKPITTGRRTKDRTEILSGIAVGEPYVAYGAFELKATLVTSGMDPHAGHGH